jgi:tetratricopeptide (TPR) repeat protein
MKFSHRLLLSLLALGSLPALALSDASRTRLENIQSRWAEVNYQLPAQQREGAFADLAQLAASAVSAEPAAAELRVWHGIVLGTYAGAKGGLGALDLVKQAKAELEQAITLDAKVLGGSAYTSLGSLYYQVPGWPLGFGDDAKAEAMLKQALALNPNGIDPNYFYGDYLARAKRFEEAKVALEKALQAPARPNRLSADAGRKLEIQALLSTVKAELR